MDELCSVFISIENGVPCGELCGFDKKISFNPLTILTELSYKQEPLEVEDFDFDDFDYTQEYAFGIVMPLKKEELKQYVYLVRYVKQVIKKSYDNSETISLTELEYLRSFFEITFQFTAISRGREPNSLLQSRRLLHDRPLTYNSFDMYKFLEEGKSLYKKHLYQCYSHADIIFSILHYLSLNDYKFNKCEHCGRFFATQNLKNLYCPRLSQYSGYTKFTCYEATKRIKQDIRRKHHQIYCNLQNNYMPEYCSEFELKYIEPFERLKNHPNYDNISDCYKILDKERWYTKETARIRGEAPDSINAPTKE